MFMRTAGNCVVLLAAAATVASCARRSEPPKARPPIEPAPADAANPHDPARLADQLAQQLAGAAEDMKMFARRPIVGQTYVEVDGTVYGARGNPAGPIGGGEGYTRAVAKGDLTATTFTELLAALRRARHGQTVFIPGDVEIDCTGRVLIDHETLRVPAGVTLASDRGRAGSRGALLFSDAMHTSPLIEAAGKNVRITGLRLRGPDPHPRIDHHERSFRDGRGHEYYYKLPNSIGIRAEENALEVDNCELAGWSHAAVFLKGGEGHHVHHCYIHHNQRNGLGYGVCHDTASSLIEQNLFNYNRHSIAGTGRPPSGYEARDNVELGQSLSHCFDMHGGRDRDDGTDIAGTWMKVHHNTFRPTYCAVRFRGAPQKDAVIHHNWFYSAVRGAKTTDVATARTRVYDNAYGRTEPRILDAGP